MAGGLELFQRHPACHTPMSVEQRRPYRRLDHVSPIPSHETLSLPSLTEFTCSETMFRYDVFVRTVLHVNDWSDT